MRTILASFLFVDVVGFSKVSANEQHAFKAALVPVLQRGLAILAPQDYRLRDTGDGALITFLSNPEHALYLALWIAEVCGKPADGQVLALKNLRTGINLGTVRESMDVESRPNFVGDGINAAQRIMDFAQPGQVTASRSYMEAVALLDSAYAALFEHLGPRADKHGRQHELFSVTPDENVLEHMRRTLAVEEAAEPLDLDLGVGITLPPRPITPPPAPATYNAPPAPAPAPQIPAVATPVPSWEPVANAPVVPSRPHLRRALGGGLILMALVAMGGLGMSHYLRLRSEPATDPSPRPAPVPGSAAATAPAPAPAPVPAPAPAPASAPVTTAPPEPLAAPTTPTASPPTSAGMGNSNAADPPSAAIVRPEKPKPARPAAAPLPPVARSSEPPPPSAAAAPAAPSPRCSRIMQKASIGETLTPAEQKEIANSC